MIMENQQKIIGKKKKKFHVYGITFACLILILSAFNCSNICYFGRYASDIISGKDLYSRQVDNPNWAKKLELPGVSNFHKVSDDLYRGAQPTKEGMKALKEMGIKTIVNLRDKHSDEEELDGLDLVYKEIPMKATEPKVEDMIAFLNIVTDSNNTPVFVHCRYGADRTGVVCALYRIAVQDRTKEEAIEEMTKGGYGFHSIYGNLPVFLQNFNIEEIRQKAEPQEQIGDNLLFSVPN